MSKRTNSHFKKTTSQIMLLLDRNELSFRELVWNLRQDEKEISQDIKKLVADGVIARKFHHNDVMYTRVHETPIVHILHTLEQRLR